MKNDLNNNSFRFPDHFDQNNQTLAIEKIIQPFLRGNLSRNQLVELYQTGKFLAIRHGKIKLIQHMDRPDFLISNGQGNVGLEHERIFNEEKIQLVKTVAHVFDGISSVFRKLYPDCKILVNCWLNYTEFNSLQDDPEKIKTEFAHYVFESLQNSNTHSKPDYVDRVVIIKHHVLDFFFNPGIKGRLTIDYELLKNAIAKKNHLVKNYRSNTGLNNQWLLLVIAAISPETFDLNQEIIQTAADKSEFDKIYLLEDYHARVWELK